MLRIRPNDLTHYACGWFFRLRTDGDQQCMTLDVSLGYSRSMTFTVRENGNIMSGTLFLTRLLPDGTGYRIEHPDCLIGAVDQSSAAA